MGKEMVTQSSADTTPHIPGMEGLKQAANSFTTGSLSVSYNLSVLFDFYFFCLRET